MTRDLSSKNKFNIFHITAIAIICCVLYCYWPFPTPLTEVDEARYASASREMLESGDVFIPRFNYEPRYQKPILIYWLQQIPLRIFGVSEASVRFVSALASLIAAICVYAFLCDIFRKSTTNTIIADKCAFLAALAFASMPLISIWARSAVTDPTLTLFITLAIFCIFKSHIAPETRNRCYLLAGIFSGFAVLTKGPLGVIVPFLVWLAYHIINKTLFQEAKHLPWARTILAVCVIAVPWYASTYFFVGTSFLERFFLTENLERYSTIMEGHGINNRLLALFSYFPIAFIAGFPASIFAALEIFTKNNYSCASEEIFKLRRFSLVWIAAVCLFFGTSRTQLPSYIQSVAAPIAILFAIFFFKVASKPIEISAFRRPIFTAFIASMFCLIFYVGILSVFLKGSVNGPMGTVAFGSEWVPGALAAFIGCAGIIASSVLCAMRKKFQFYPILIVRFWLIFTAGLLCWIAPSITLSQYGLSKKIGLFLRDIYPNAQVVSFCPKSSESMVFYAQRRINFIPSDEPDSISKLSKFFAFKNQALVITRLSAIESIKQFGKFRTLNVIGENIIGILEKDNKSNLASGISPDAFLSSGALSNIKSSATERRVLTKEMVYNSCPYIFETWQPNIELFKLINSNRSELLDNFSTFIYSWARGEFYIAVLLIIFFFRKYKLKWFALTVVFQTIISVTVKHFAMQPRPTAILEDAHTLGHNIYYFGSFPSGEVAVATCSAILLASHEKRYVKFIAIVYVLTIMWERIYFGMHWPLDTLGGVAVGYISAYLAFRYLQSKGQSITPLQ